MLDTAAEQYANAAIKHPFEKHLNESRLTNARLARDKDELPVPSHRQLKQTFEVLDRAGSADPEMGARQSQKGRLWLLRLRSNNGCDESVSPPCYRFDIVRRLRIIAKG
jgi:hypothetical protein